MLGFFVREVAQKHDRSPDIGPCEAAGFDPGQFHNLPACPDTGDDNSMTKRITLSAALALATAATVLSSTAADAKAQELRSTYTNTSSCATVEEGEDRFTLECAAPGGGKVHVILSYWDGRAFVAYEPFYKPGERAQLRTIASDASRVFGQKIEWRMHEGEKTACAAIVRVHSTKAGVLAVHDLATGRHLGDAHTNAQARKLADTACLSRAKPSRSDAGARPVDAPPDVASSSGAADLSPTAAVIPVSEPGETVAQAAQRGESIKEAARRGQKAFDDVYRTGGISSAVDDIKACYKKLQRQPSKTALAQCAAMDILGGNVDAMMAQGNPQLMQKYFDRGRATDKRIAAGLKKLGLGKQQRATFEKELAGTLGATLGN